MKHSALLLLFLLFASVLSAKDVVIVNPVYKVKTTGITSISKIELKANETRVHLHTVFLPHWWVKFSMTNYIEDCATGKKLYPMGMENGELEKEIYMPDSGDSTFVLLFPKLDKSVKKINFRDVDTKDPFGIYGISLNPKTKAKAKQDTPPVVLKWIENETAKAKRTTLMNEDEFFSNDTVYIVGYIKGYSPLAGFSTGIVYASNQITREDYPIVIQIHEDGRFEGELPVNHPQYLGLLFGNKYIHFYIEPGQTLGMVLDWEEFLLADRLRDRQYTFKDIRFFGPTALINQELTAFYSQEKELPYRMLYSEDSNRKTPDEYKALLNSTIKEYKENLQRALNEQNWDKRTKTFLRNDYAITYATFLWEYEMSYSYNKNRGGDKLPLDFYDFLQDIAMNDRRLLSTSKFNIFINRFEYADPFRTSNNAFNLMRSKKSVTEYLFEELGLQKTPEDIAYLEKVDSANIYLYGSKQEELADQEKESFRAKIDEMSSAFEKRYEKQMEGYQKKYLDPLSLITYADVREEEWRIKDSICYNVLKFKPSLLYDITKVRSLDFTLSQMIKDKKQART
ncbi:hypothetical protein EZS27_026508, partial [termite gut metagenome]